MVATFSGNVPDFDIIATDFKGRSCPIQVKTIKGGDWQFSIDKFSEISFEGKKQILGKKKSLPIPDLVCVFVIAAEKYGEDQFFVVKWSRVRDIIIKHYKYWLDIHGGNRPRKFDSLHCAISEKNLLKYRDNWELIINRF